ncbi:hypothetical protein [Vulcanisaeta sp. JCM 16161]|uniref:hypothetical protein n=2 Tax=Vulcanisaeta sp. JCM 16161 TaxID=1295372 RepID=UPI000B0528B2|nr:hypothetical protein [Vulcanisaeta sp. JCM 16161]
MANGCASGHILSGNLQMAVSSFVFFMAVIVGAIITAYIMYGLKPGPQGNYTDNVKFPLKSSKSLVLLMIVRFYKRGSDYYVDVDGSVTKVSNLRPIDYLLIALAYGLGVRYIDRYGVNEYVINCEK